MLFQGERKPRSSRKFNGPASARAPGVAPHFPLHTLVLILVSERVHKVGNLTFGGGAAKMRMTSMVAGLAIVLAACGGEKKSLGSAGRRTPDQDAGAPAAGARRPPQGATHDVNMVLEGSSYKYVPDQLTVGPNDVIRYHNKSGGPHNVAFWADSIPSRCRVDDRAARSDGPAFQQAGGGARRGDRGQAERRAQRASTSTTAPRTWRWA